jgi:hypothetical protein
VLVAQLVYAISEFGPAHGAYSTETVTNQGSYSISGVAPGTYFVYSTVRPLACLTPRGGIFAGAYTDFVKCGLDYRCPSHKLIPVTVRSNTTALGIDPEDWYDSQSNFAPPPAGIVPTDPSLQVSKPPFSSARAAAIAIATEHEAAILQDTIATCPRNRACLAIGVEHDGSQAAYFVGAAGSNGNILACAAYVYNDSSGWRSLRWRCGSGIFPAVGRSGIVFLGMGITAGCVNVRKSPGSGGAVVSCVKVGTGVRVDGGPVYAPLASMDGTWWHVAGRGWMADDYLR